MCKSRAMRDRFRSDIRRPPTSDLGPTCAAGTPCHTQGPSLGACDGQGSDPLPAAHIERQPPQPTDFRRLDDSISANARRPKARPRKKSPDDRGLKVGNSLLMRNLPKRAGPLPPHVLRLFEAVIDHGGGGPRGVEGDPQTNQAQATLHTAVAKEDPTGIGGTDNASTKLGEMDNSSVASRVFLKACLPGGTPRPTIARTQPRNLAEPTRVPGLVDRLSLLPLLWTQSRPKLGQHLPDQRVSSQTSIVSQTFSAGAFSPNGDLSPPRPEARESKSGSAGKPPNRLPLPPNWGIIPKCRGPPSEHERRFLLTPEE